MTVRISLDVSSGTFSQLEAICREEFQSKSQYLRKLVNNDIAEREGKR